jgi:hypothetical protein
MLLAGLAIALIAVVPADGAPSAPGLSFPEDGATVGFVPSFGWGIASGADRYEFQISADPGFNSPVLGSTYDHFFTKNTRATLAKVIPNGTYWWRVRSIGVTGSVSAWSARSIVKRWAAAPTLTAPADGSTISFPSQPFALSWTPVPGAYKYLVTLATDPALGSVVWPLGPVETQATAFTLSSPLSAGTYYWAITPIDAAGNRGEGSTVWSFTWVWPSTTTPVVTDVVSEPEIYDHEFSWDAIPGAAGYEVEVSRSSDFAGGSRVCCPVNSTTHMTTIGTSYSPAVVLPNNNSYYWRVRGVDASGNPSDTWNNGPPFTKSFDNIVPTVKNLHMLGDDEPFEADYETDTPIVVWDPVPGASAYEVEVTRFTVGCQWTATTEHWRSKTATTAWTPLGSGWNGVKPYESPVNVSTDSPSLVPGHQYCVRVTALDRSSDFSGSYIRSVETYLPSGTSAAFLWTGPPAGGACSPSCSLGALGSDDYLAPEAGGTTRSMPLFRWQPLAGYESYFVLVASDPDFTNVVDYAFTQLPAYAPRLGFGTKTYADETNEYYWAVLPAAARNGGGVVTAPQFSSPTTFLKQSIPPTLVYPADGAVFDGQVRFKWTPAEGARRYRLQVAADTTFSTIKEDLFLGTDSTTYTSSETYPADRDLYWRVRAEDENGIGLTWSRTGTFRKTLSAPVPASTNPTSGDALPTWQWAPVSGAVSYDVQLEYPNGTIRLFSRLPSSVVTPTEMKGTGVWHWQARANFPRVNSTQVVAGPWSVRSSFARTIHEPTSPTEDVGQNRLLLRWDVKLGARSYRVQVSKTPDFASPLETATADNAGYAPLLMLPTYAAGGTFYWRVAAADDSFANTGDYTAPRSFSLPVVKAPSSITAAIRKTTASVRVTGSVSPAHAGKTVSVSLYRKRNGVFVRLSTKSAVLSFSSAYSTSFARPRPGTCKVTSRFPGDTDHLASSKSVTFSC